jgi:hypothetical protein
MHPLHIPTAIGLAEANQLNVVSLSRAVPLEPVIDC